MSSPSRFTAGVACKIVAIFALISVLFVAGCTTSNTVANTAPGFSSAGSTAFTMGVAGTFTVAATGSPAPTLAESGALPNGVTFNASNGVLAGMPATGTAGSYPVTFNATNGVGTGATQSFMLTVVAPPAITSFTAAKTTITAGTSTTLTAVFSGGTGSINNGVGTVTNNTAVTITPAATTTYTLTVTNTAGAAVTNTATVTVVPAPSITSFLAAKTTITAGTSTTLTAVFVGTGSVDNSLGAVTSGAAATVTPAVTTTYTLTVTNAAGATPVTAAVTVTVVAAPAITSFTSATASITAGTPNTLTAVFVNGTGSVNNGVGAVNSGIAANITPAATTTYTLTVTNAAGTAVTATATVTVVPAPVITSFSAAQTTITAGTSTSLTAVFSAGLGSIDNGVGSVNNNIAVGITPAVTTTYTLTVTNTLGTSVTATATVTVVPAPQITSFVGVPSPIVVGNPSTLTAVFTGGNGAVNNGVGAVSSGTGTNVSPAVTTTYTLTVTNAAGTSVTAQTTVTVQSPPTITSTNHSTFTEGATGSFTVTTTGFPAPSLSDGGATLPNGVTFTDNLNGTATLTGIPGSGTSGAYTFTITAHNGIGADNTQSFTLTVNTAPVITSTNNATFTVGTAGSFTVTTTGTPTASLGETGALPNSVTFTNNGDGTATLAGTPAPGTGKAYAITITASNGVGSPGTQTFTLTVDQAPAITSASAITFTEGASSSLTVTATGFPKPALSDGGATLPTGVTFQDNGDGTATLSGTPAGGTAASSPYSFTVTASNGTLPNATQPFTLTVNTLPTFTSASSTTFTVGTLGSFTVTATGSPTFTETGALPNGVGLNSNGTLSGTPAANTGGAYPISIKATNGSGNTSQSFTLTVDQTPVFTSTNTATFVVGTPGSFSVVTSAFPNPALGDGGATLPSGVSFQDNGDGTATLSGTPATGTAGNYPFTITASNGIGTNTQSFTLTVSTSSQLSSFSISGTVTYAGSHTGNTILRVFTGGCTGCNNVVAGTSLSSAPSPTGTSYTIRGLAPTNTGGYPQSYVVYAQIDTQGTGITNESNPEGFSTTFTVPSSNNTSINVTVVDRTPPSAPSTPSGFKVAPGDTTALVQYKPVMDKNNEEIATSYKLYYGTDTNASNGVGSPATFTAQGQGTDIFVLHNLANGLTYFKLTAVNIDGESAATTAVPVTLGPASGANSVSGTITFPGTPTGPLYVGLYGDNGIFITAISNPVSPQAYTLLGIPAGTYQNFAVIDMNRDSEADAGDLENVGSHTNPPTVTVSGTTTGADVTLTNASAIISVSTSVQESSGQPNSYNISLQVGFGTKLPISMTLLSGPNVAAPYDMNADQHSANYNPVFNSSVSPIVGDTYQFLVSFSDGTTETIPAQVTAVLSSSFARNLTMQTTTPGSPTVPLLTWTAPSPAPAASPYDYQVSVNNANGTSQENWYYSGGNNNSGNGIPSSQTNVLYNIDGQANPNSPLIAGTYNWSVTVQDSNNNSVSYTTTYVVP